MTFHSNFPHGRSGAQMIRDAYPRWTLGMSDAEYALIRRRAHEAAAVDVPDETQLLQRKARAKWHAMVLLATRVPGFGVNDEMAA